MPDYYRSINLSGKRVGGQNPRQIKLFATTDIEKVCTQFPRDFINFSNSNLHWLVMRTPVSPAILTRTTDAMPWINTAKTFLIKASPPLVLLCVDRDYLTKDSVIVFIFIQRASNATTYWKPRQPEILRIVYHHPPDGRRDRGRGENSLRSTC